MKARVLVTETIADAAIDVLTEGDVDVDVREGFSAQELVAAIPAYDGLIVRSGTKVTAEVIEAARRLRVIGRAGVGIDNVDLDAATRRGVVVVNAPSNRMSTAEHTVGMLLALVRRIPQAHAALSSGRWEKQRFYGTELHDKVLGIIGFGPVGVLVAQRCHAFGMRIIARDPYISPQRFARTGVEPVELDELLARSDVISLHVNMSPDNIHLLGAAELEKCKPGVFIVNTSRGGVIDEKALAAAIKAGRVGGAALDVFETEPITWSPLFDLPEVVVTPHISGQTTEAQDKASTMAAEQVLLALRGEFAPNAVNVAAELPEALKEYVPLAEKLGKLACALSRAAASQLDVEFRGRVAEEDTRILTLAALRGFLQPTIQEPVTYVNAAMIATDRGLEVSDRRAPQASDYVNLVRVNVRGDVPVTVAGALMGPRNEARLVEIDGVEMEIPFTPYMAFCRYEDRPRVIYKMTGVLGDHDINIAGFKVGRSERGGEAIMGMSVDSEIPQDVFEEAMRAAEIPHGKFVVL